MKKEKTKEEKDAEFAAAVSLVTEHVAATMERFKAGGAGPDQALVQASNLVQFVATNLVN